MKGRKSVGWWVAQAFVAALVLGIVCRIPGLSESKNPARLRSIPISAKERHSSLQDPRNAESWLSPPPAGAVEVEGSPVDGPSSQFETLLRGSPYAPQRYAVPCTVSSADEAFETWNLDPRE